MGEVLGIRHERVCRWFAEHIPGVELPLRFEPIVGGHSNLTYRVTDGRNRRYVLRRPPLGAVLQTAHDMEREHRIISALASTSVPVPPALGLCQDEDVNDAPFYVMGYVDGVVLADAQTARQSFAAPERHRLGLSFLDTLARLHAVEAEEIGLGDLGRKEEYLPRQLKRWRRQWESSKTRDLAAMDEVYEALRQAIPRQHGYAIVHGDYRLGNCLSGADATIAAVLDWELCTLGDPLADVGYLLNNWNEPGEPPISPGSRLGPSAAEGFVSRRELVTAYQEATGRDLAEIDYYRAFQYWRLAAIVEGVLARYLKKVMVDDSVDTDGYRLRVEALARAALERARRLA